MRRYHELEAYKLARILVATVYTATAGAKAQSDQEPAQELRQAALSTALHLVDLGAESSAEKDRRSLERSLDELGHVASCIRKVRDAGQLSLEAARSLLSVKARVGAALASSVSSLAP